jgi:hypothetical protein
MKEDVTNIHLFAFGINLQSNLETEDIDSMIFLQNSYPFFQQYISLIVTHSEETKRRKNQ